MPHSEVMYNALSIYWFSLTVLLNIFTMVVVCTILLCCGKGVFCDVGYLIVRFWPLLVFFRSAWFYIFLSCNTTLGIKMFLHYQYYRHHHRQHHHQVAIIVYVCWFVAFFSVFRTIWSHCPPHWFFLSYNTQTLGYFGGCAINSLRMVASP